MTNAYTTFRRLKDRAQEGIHKIIDFHGTVMTDSGGYQVLEFGAIDILVEDMARFEEQLGSDIAIILDKPTGLNVTRKYSVSTVKETLRAASRTRQIVSREDQIWTLPIQGGKYLDLVAKSAEASAKFSSFFGCYALGSPVEVMEEYDFSLLVRMILASKKRLPKNRVFHLFGAGHPLILPLAVALGCDTFDSASYMLYAKEDRYISSSGTVRLDRLEYLGCTCKICTKFSARELKALPREERNVALASHNLAILRQVVEETKQAIWEGRLWEYAQSKCRAHPRALQAFEVAAKAGGSNPWIFDLGTASIKDRGIFNYGQIDQERPELRNFRERKNSLDLTRRKMLLILPETQIKPFLKSKIFRQLQKLLGGDYEKALVTFVCPNLGLVPAELSDIYPVSQSTNAYFELPDKDTLLNRKKWPLIVVLAKKNTLAQKWIESKVSSFSVSPSKHMKRSNSPVVVKLTYSYKQLKREISKAVSGIDRL